MLLQILDDCLRFAAGAPYHGGTLLPGLADDFSLLLHDFRLGFFDFQLHVGNTLLALPDFSAALLIHQFFLFQLIQHMFKLGMIRLHQLLRPEHQAFRQTQAAGNRKSIAGPRLANQQPVCRAQRLHIKFHTGIFDARLAVGKGLQLRIMRGSHRGRADFQQALQDGRGQCCAFIRVCACSKLIQQQKIITLCLPQNFHDMRHMGRKG